MPEGEELADELGKARKLIASRTADPSDFMDIGKFGPGGSKGHPMRTLAHNP
jgi:hypothetical protein